MTWLVKDATWIYNPFLLHTDGQTSYERRSGRTYNRSICEFGEVLLYRPMRHDIPKAESKLGRCTQSDENYIGTSEGVLRTEEVKGPPKTARYQVDDLKKARAGGRLPLFVLPNPLRMFLSCPTDHYDGRSKQGRTPTIRATSRR